MSSWRTRALAGVALLALLVVAGRVERQRQITAQARGMRSVERVVGPLASPSLSGYRELPGFGCLTYRRGADPFALDLCFDATGRVVEAIDRRTTDRHIWTLRFAPATSPVRVDVREAARLFRKMGAA